MNLKKLKIAYQLMGGQQQLADVCGVTQTSVHKWLTGKTTPHPYHALAIEKATNRRVSRLDLIPEFFKDMDVKFKEAKNANHKPKIAAKGRRQAPQRQPKTVDHRTAGETAG